MDSNNPRNIYFLIRELLREGPNIAKKRRNMHQNYTFRGIDDFYESFQPIFAKLGIILSNEILNFKHENRESGPPEKIKVTTSIYLTIRWRFTSVEDGSFITIDSIGEGFDQSDKASNKAMSGSLKYALTFLGLVPTSEDIDSESTSPELPPKLENKPAPKEFNPQAMVEKMKANQKPFTPTPYKFKDAPKPQGPLFDEGDVSL